MTKYCYENKRDSLDNPYEYENKCNWSKDIEEDYRKKYYFEYINNVPVKRFASEVIKKLHEEGNKIIIIIGRYKTKEYSELGQQIRNSMVNWLKNNNIIYDEICYASFPKSKEIQAKKIDIMIDDCPEVLKAISKYTIAFCFNNIYNMKLEYDNIIRVF